MGRVFKGLVVSGAVALIASSGMPASAQQAGDVQNQHFVCGSNEPPDLDDQPFRQSMTDLRLDNGSGMPCGTARKGDWLNYHCFTLGGDGQTWTYVAVVGQHVAGWAPDAKLPGNGSNKPCPR
ncbi:hypothetical protein DMH04_07765 [Kibdelosporangium aridum]|uniref:SH3 domain-containing protein n=1 Tax=Kibdelosporangium aridum TaxID=2030 RepID=A0A428ZKP1_KIBAR|nr:hypothetical protein DMH04_07765 [Kibdelosporangium aridum]